MNKQILIAAVLLALFVGAGAGYWLATKQPSNSGETTPSGSVARQPVFYRNPMNPAITSPVPAKDDMGMDYIPVYADGGQGGDAPTGTVSIDPMTVQNTGVRTATAERKALSRAIRAVGRVAFNEERLARLHPKTEGWIEELRIGKTGSPVRQGDILLSIYSPQLVASQEEYLLALNNRQVLADSPYEEIRQGAESLAKTARERLEFLDVPQHQIHELEQTRIIKKTIHIHSPFDGIVMQVGAREGQFVSPATELYMIADLAKVWVYADVYESDLPWVRAGDNVEMRLRGIPGKTFKGRLDYIYPYAEAKTRTVKVRLAFANPGLLLKPDMFADVTILAANQPEAIVIPSQAVVRSGVREQVFIVRGAGKFEPREVKTGVSADGMTQILDGVQNGDEVVVSALFLIDSESKLREATAKMLDAQIPVSEMDMSDMTMDTLDTGKGHNHD
jgi:Cu(I)/Ag(I) efflux system membrane fusion protein